MVDHFTKLWLIVSWRSLKLQEKLTTLTELVYSTRMIVNRYISVENFLHNSVPVACGKLIAAWYIQLGTAGKGIRCKPSKPVWVDAIEETSFVLRTAQRLGCVQTDATLLNVTCWVRLHTLLHVVGCCYVLLRKVWNRSNFSANNSQHFFCSVNRRSVAQQCWIRLHSSSNIVGAAHAHYAWFTKTYGLYPSHDALQVPTLLAQQCWKLLRPFARSLT